MQPARFSVFFRIRKSRNISGPQGKTTNRVRLVHWGISGSSTFLYPVHSSKSFSEIRVCAMSRILNHGKSFHAQRCPPGPIMHSPRNSCRMWRCRIVALVIRYCSTYFYLTSWWASNESMGFREGHFWQSTMDSMYWNMAKCGVPCSYWTSLNQKTLSWKWTVLYIRSLAWLRIDNNAGAGWCWIEADYFWERIFFLYCNSKNTGWLLKFSFPFYWHALSHNNLLHPLRLPPH